MSGFQFTLMQAPQLRLDLSPLLPAALAGMEVAQVAKLPLWHGNEQIAVGDVFMVDARTDGHLGFEGDLSRCDRIGQGLAEGVIEVNGDVGDYLAAQMRNGVIRVFGKAGVYAACEMAGGRLDVAGDVGDFAASALPGDLDGMRGGVFVIGGDAGARCGDRMRRGSLVIHGDAGDFLASRMVAGTIALGGACGAHPAWGMRRGSLIFAGAQPELPPTFQPTGHDIRVIWALLSRDLTRYGGRFASLPKRTPRRLVGDLGADGKGEILLPC